ncbi:MAG: TRAP transporter large permease subunit, partial [Planctomycetota bacterium]
MFYEPVFEYGGLTLVARPDTDRYYISWYDPGSGRHERQSTRTADLEAAKDRLIELARVMTGWLPGGLGHVNVAVSMLFAGISGSSTADAAGIG